MLSTVTAPLAGVVLTVYVSGSPAGSVTPNVPVTVPVLVSGVPTVGVPATGSRPRGDSIRRKTSNTSNCNGFVGGTAPFGKTSGFTRENKPATKPKNGFTGVAGVTGVTAGVTGVTAGITAACMTAGVDDEVTCGVTAVTAAVTPCSEPVLVDCPDADDPIPGPVDSGWITVCTRASASTTPWCTTWVTTLPSDEVESDDGLEVVDAVTSGVDDFGVISGVVEPGVDGVPVVVVVLGTLPPLEDSVLDGGACR